MNKTNNWSKSTTNKYANAVSLANKRKGENMKQLEIRNVMVDLSESPKISVNASQLFTAMLLKWNNQPGYQNDPVINLDLNEYLELKGIKNTPDARKKASRTIKQLIKEIYHVSYYHESGKKKEWYHALESMGYEKDGSSFHITLSQPFFKLLKSKKNNFALPIPLKLFQVNPSRNKYTWLIGLYLLQATRLARGDSSKPIIIKNMLHSINMKDNSNVYRQVIIPTIKALDQLKEELNLLDYKIVDVQNDKKEVDPHKLKGVHLEDFINYRLYVTWKNYPQEWIKAPNKKVN